MAEPDLADLIHRLGRLEAHNRIMRWIVGATILLALAAWLFPQMQAVNHQVTVRDPVKGGAVSMLFDPNSFGTKELLLRSSAENLNEIALQNTFGGNSFSAMAFRGGRDGIERGAIGYGNVTADRPFRDSTYIEASYFTGSPHTSPPSALKFVQTGYLGGHNGTRLRQEFTRDGEVRFYQLDGEHVDFVLANGKIGFFNAKPVEIQSANDPAGVISALRAYGLLN